jgi:hypothetical protein
MANNSIEYKTAQHIGNGLNDNRLSPWILAQALRALPGQDTQNRLVSGLIIPYVTVRTMDWEHGNFVQNEFEHLRFCKMCRDLARDLQVTDEIRMEDVF